MNFDDVLGGAKQFYGGGSDAVLGTTALGNYGLGENGLDIMGTGATKRAIDAQTNATNQANATQKYMFDQTRNDLAPWRQAGFRSLMQIENNNFMDNWKKDPGYEFRLAEGNKAINAGASARGMANSGATMKALAKYGQDYSTNEYNNVHNREYNRLSGLAGIGNNANNTQVGANSAYGNAVSGNQIGMGNAVASANIAQANRNAGMVGAGMTAMFASDERLKTNIEPVTQADLNEMKEHLRAYAFNYNSDVHGKGDWIGVMAQDLEKSKLGKTLVVENANGEKLIDAHKVMSLFLATMAEA